MRENSMSIDIFDLQDIAVSLDLANRKPEVDTTEWWDSLDVRLPSPEYRMYSQDRGVGGQLCHTPNCDSILTIADGNYTCRQCKLEGIGF